MRFLLSLALLAALAWSGYWALAARGIERGLAGWLDSRRAEGWAADAGRIAVTGFPTRFDTRLAPLELADPDSGLAWSMPEFGFSAQSHRPQRLIAHWPETQQIATPFERIAVTAEAMTGALAFRPGLTFELASATFSVGAFGMVSDAGWRASMDGAGFSMAAVEDRPGAQHLRFSASGMRPPAGLVATLDPAGLLPPVFQRVSVEAVAVFDAPWDRRALEERRPQLRRVEIGRLDAQWGDLALQAAGSFDVDAEGQPSGSLTLRATNWREMIAIARNSGQLPAALADRLEDALGLLAGLSGRPDMLDVPLRFALGQTWLGPVPLGPAPNFRLR
ncbi:DUF2125 domain-containing protein [Rhodovulum sp. YEN HP10]|uniref:DUF2125 domain-containing protein n=1 Tax=Rhodovulum sp. HP10 TaxID=3387397 RepID=UPI0039E17330